MIRPGSNITLRPYKIYRNDRSRDVPIGYGEDRRGKYLQFQVLDINSGLTKKLTGYAYVNIYTEIPLKIDDIVTVKEILYVQVKKIGLNTITIIGLKIKQTNPGVIDEDIMECKDIEGVVF